MSSPTHELNSRANIAALRSVGACTIIAFSAVGGLQKGIKPYNFVIPNQIVDRTKGIRPFTFFESGLVGHFPFAGPFDEAVAQVVRTCRKGFGGDGVALRERGTLICKGTRINDS